MSPYTPRSRIGGLILTLAIEGVLSRENLARMLRKLQREEGPKATRQCRDWLIWIGGYPVKVIT